MLTKYENGAEVDITTVARYDSTAGVEIDVEGVYRYNATDGVEETVWSGMIYMNNELLYSATNTEVWISTTDYACLMKYYSADVGGSLIGGGYWTFYAEGNFVNPIIDFNWGGGLTYYTSTSYTTVRRKTAGTISIYARTKDGTETYTTAVSSVGTSTTVSTDGEWYQDEGTATIELTGEYDRLGFRFEPKSYSNGTYYDAQQEISVGAVTVNGKQVSFIGLPEYNNIPE